MSEWLNTIGCVLGFRPSSEELKKIAKYSSAYKSLDVVGRGTVIVDTAEVIRDLSAKNLYNKAKHIVNQG